MGIKLNTANIMFIIENFTQNIINALPLFRKVSFIHIPSILAKINSIIIHHIASTKLVAGHANATISSPFSGSL
jgi:hypothetical protein